MTLEKKNKKQKIEISHKVAFIINLHKTGKIPPCLFLLGSELSAPQAVMQFSPGQACRGETHPGHSACIRVEEFTQFHPAVTWAPGPHPALRLPARPLPVDKANAAIMQKTKPTTSEKCLPPEIVKGHFLSSIELEHSFPPTFDYEKFSDVEQI